MGYDADTNTYTVDSYGETIWTIAKSVYRTGSNAGWFNATTRTYAEDGTYTDDSITPPNTWRPGTDRWIDILMANFDNDVDPTKQIPPGTVLKVPDRDVITGLYTYGERPVTSSGHGNRHRRVVNIFMAKVADQYGNDTNYMMAAWTWLNAFQVMDENNIENASSSVSDNVIKTESYKIRWEYDVDGIWQLGEEQENVITDYSRSIIELGSGTDRYRSDYPDSRVSIYELPENANQVRVSILPVSAEKTAASGSTAATYWFDGLWSTTETTTIYREGSTTLSPSYHKVSTKYICVEESLTQLSAPEMVFYPSSETSAMTLRVDDIHLNRGNQVEFEVVTGGVVGTYSKIPVALANIVNIPSYFSPTEYSTTTSYKKGDICKHTETMYNTSVCYVYVANQDTSGTVEEPEAWDSSKWNYIETTDVSIGYAESQMILLTDYFSNFIKARCRLVSGVYKGPWSEYSDELWLQPQTPQNVTAVEKDDEANDGYGVLLRWSHVSGKDISYTIEYTTNSEYFSSNSEGNITSITGISGSPRVYIESESKCQYWVTGLQANNTYYFRIKAVSKDSYSSNPSTAIQVSIGSTPSIPTTWVTNNSVVLGDDSSIAFYWLHNSDDGSKMSYARLTFTRSNGIETAEVQYYIQRIPGTGGAEDTLSIVYPSPVPTWFDFTNMVSGTTYGLKINLNDSSIGTLFDNKFLTFQIETAGVKLNSDAPSSPTYEDYVYGEKSVVKEVKVYKKPSLGSISTSLDAGLLPITVSFTGLGSTVVQQPVSYTLEVLHRGASTVSNTNFKGETYYVSTDDVMYSETWAYDSEASTSITKTLTAYSLPWIQNGTTVVGTYKVRVTVGMSSGLSAYSDSSEFTLNLARTTAGTITSITPDITDYTADIVVTGNGYLYRKNVDGVLTLISQVTNASASSPVTITDEYPALGEISERAVFVEDDSGVRTVVDQTATSFIFSDYSGIILNWVDSNFVDQSLKLPYNIDISDTYSHNTASAQYVGRRYPVIYHDIFYSGSKSISLSVPKYDTTTINKLRSLGLNSDNVYIREPNGDGYWAAVNVTMTNTHAEVVIPVTLDISRTEGG